MPWRGAIAIAFPKRFDQLAPVLAEGAVYIGIVAALGLVMPSATVAEFFWIAGAILAVLVVRAGIQLAGAGIKLIRIKGVASSAAAQTQRDYPRLPPNRSP